MSRNKPLVSVLISVYNAGEYLRPSLQSILDQTYPNLEIIIIDDGSTDGCIGSIEEIKDPRVRILTQKNNGKATALNRGLDVLSGVFYATHDADDISHPDRIKHQVQCMLENPQIAAVFIGYDLILNGRHVAPRFQGKDVEQCRQDIEQFMMPSNDPTGMYRMSMVRNIRYEPTLRIGQGFDYILRVGEIYPMMLLGECLYSYRVHFASTTRRNSDLRKQMIQRVLTRACQRRGVEFTNHFQSESKLASRFVHREYETCIVPHFMKSVLDLRLAGQRWESLKTAFTCLHLHPFDPYYYKPLCYFLTPMKLIRYYRSRKAKARDIWNLGD